MPVIVLALHKTNVLIATGGRWLRDGKSSAEQAKIAEDQRSTKGTAEEATKDILTRLPANCLMKPVVKRDGHYTTRFITKASPHPPGFIKGTYPDPDHPKEGAKAAADREFQEETFTVIDGRRLTEVSINSQIYKLVLTDDEADKVIKNWKAQYDNGIGELVDLKWVPIADVLANHEKDAETYNPESRKAIPYLKRYKGGVRVFSRGMNKMVKTRSMTRRAKTARKQKSHCVGIKRSAVCKRTDGCKYASGTKRRFCRTAKNRKHH
jgi:hypothetical protein